MNDKDFVVNVGPGGTFTNSGVFQTQPSDIDSIFQRLEDNSKNNITIFFHGGLVNEAAGLTTARKMAAHISNAGSIPICFVWETGLIETVLCSKISDIANRKIFQKIIKVLIKKLSQKLGFDSQFGRGQGLMMSDLEIEVELSREMPFENFESTSLFDGGRGSSAINQLPKNETLLEADLELEFRNLILLDAEFQQIIASSELAQSDQRNSGRGIFSTVMVIKKIASIALRVIKRYLKKRDHGFYPTIVEEVFREFFIADLGSWIWNEMKVKSRIMWNDNIEKSNNNQYVGRYFLDKLIAYKKNHPELKVNLIGHSAGSIAICNLLKQSFQLNPDFKYNHIIFIAPACRVDLFRNEILNHQEKYTDFRAFIMSDENEKKDVLVPYIYTRSLLYLVSGIFEDEGTAFDAYILGMERHINGVAPYNDLEELMTTVDYLLNPHEGLRLVLSQTKLDSPTGLQTQALKHGAFDDDEATINSIKFIISQ